MRNIQPASRDAADHVSSGCDIGVAIVNYRSASLILGLIERWSRELCSAPRIVEIVVVDNDPGELDARVDWLGLPVTYLQSAGNVGYAPAVNAACGRLTTPYVLLLNPDAEIAIEAVDRMAAVLDSELSVGAVAPLHVDHEGKVTNPYRRIPSWVDLASHRTRLQRFEWARRRKRRYLCEELDGIHAGWPPSEVEQPPASCLLLRRGAIADEVMDERFPILFNDVDLSARLRLGGWRMLVDPRVSCRHEPATSTRYLGIQGEAEFYVGAYRFVEKWEGRVRAEAFRTCIIAELTFAARHQRGPRAESLQAIRALLRDRSVFDGLNQGDPVRAYWPPGVSVTS